MEKIFDFSLKLGKKFVIVLMFLLLLSTIISIFTALLSFIPEKTKTPIFSEVLAQQEALYGDGKQNNKLNKKYILVINEIVNENNLNNYGKNVFVTHLENIDEEIKDEYTKGLKPFIKDYYTYMQGKNITEDMLYGVLDDYKNEFILQNKIRDIKQATKDIKKVVSLSTLLSSLFLFLLCLLFPLLLQIEKNSRK